MGCSAVRRGPSLLQVRRYASIDAVPTKPSSGDADDGSVAIGLEPVTECVLELRRRFNDIALFFYDAIKVGGGTMVWWCAGGWRWLIP